MLQDLNARTILEMAETIEKNGYTFYRKAADEIKDLELKPFLLELAEMEVGHEKLFASMKSNLSPKESEELVFDPFDEAAVYIQALADTRVFYEKTIDTSSAEEVFKAAIEAEKESIVFYLGMKELVPEDAGKSKIDDIIREEMKHIQMISKKWLAYKK